MSFPNKAERERCWGSKDKLWECLDANNENVQLCKDFRKSYEDNCSKQWVKHFDRRRQYEKFKAKMDDQNWTDPLSAK